MTAKISLSFSNLYLINRTRILRTEDETTRDFGLKLYVKVPDLLLTSIKVRERSREMFINRDI